MQEDLPAKIKERMRRVYSPLNSVRSSDGNRVPTGIPGFDEMLSGGVPRGQLALLLGEAGVGKTIFSSQFLAAGLSRGENGVYVSLKDSKSRFMAQGKLSGWDFESAERDGKFAFVNWSPLEIDEDDFSVDGFLTATEKSVKSVNAVRIVVDPLDILRYFYFDKEERKLIFRIFRRINRFNTTSIFVMSLTDGGVRLRQVQPEEYLAQSIIVMQHVFAGSTMERTIRVEKMLETPVDRTPRPYRLTDRGIEVYPRESVI